MNQLLADFLIALTVFGAGFGLGWFKEHNELTVLQAEVKTAGEAQARQKKITEDENHAQTLQVAQAYGDDINRLHIALANRVRGPANNCGGMPNPASSTASVDGTGRESTGTCEGTEFYNHALGDALKVQAWQDWAKRMRLPIEAEQ